MTTKERVLQIIEETAEEELPRTFSEMLVYTVRALEALAQDPELV